MEAIHLAPAVCYESLCDHFSSVALALEKHQQLISLHAGASSYIGSQIYALAIRGQQVAVNIVDVFVGGVLVDTRDDVLVRISDVHIWLSIWLKVFQSPPT